MHSLFCRALYGTKVGIDFGLSLKPYGSVNYLLIVWWSQKINVCPRPVYDYIKKSIWIIKNTYIIVVSLRYYLLNLTAAFFFFWADNYCFSWSIENFSWSRVSPSVFCNFGVWDPYILCLYTSVLFGIFCGDIWIFKNTSVFTIFYQNAHVGFEYWLWENQIFFKQLFAMLFILC